VPQPLLTQGIYTYIINADGQATIRSINHQGFAGGLTIPATLGECPVTRIELTGSIFCPGLTSVTIPSSVTSISEEAFSDCASLLTITVATANENYCSVDGVLFNKNKTTLIQHPAGKAGKYVIPAGVTSIGSGALSNCGKLTEITIPTGVTLIGSRAFSNCTKLAEITIPASVTNIQLSAFTGCDALTSIAVEPDNKNYSSVKGVLFNKDKTTLLVCPTAMAGTYVIPEGVTEIGPAAFSSFRYYGGSRSFVTPAYGNLNHACNKLTSLSLPASLTNIDASELSGCSSLNTITVAAANPEFSSTDGVLFNKDQTELIKCPPAKAGSYTIPIGVISIRSSAFSECDALTDMIIPDSVIGIPQGTFNGCRPNISNIQSGGPGGFGGSMVRSIASGNYTYTVENGHAAIRSLKEDCTGSLTIPCALGGYPVTGIAAMAETDCPGPANITLPAGITHIGNAAFARYTGLKEITVNDANKYYSSLNGVLFDKERTALLQYPRGKSGEFEIPASVTSIELEALAACPGLTAIGVDPANADFSSRDGVLFNKDQTLLIQYPAGKAGSYIIPSGVTSISGRAFSGCTGLTGITIPDSIAERATATPISFIDVFRGCTKLSAITVSETHPDYRSVDGILFNKEKTTLILCPAGKAGSCSIPAGVTDIEYDAFSGCGALSRLAIPASLYSLGTPPPRSGGSSASYALPRSRSNGLAGPISSGSSSASSSSFGGVRAGGGDAFSSCTGLTEITVDQANENYSSQDGVLFNKNNTFLIRCPARKTGAYTIPSGVTTFHYNAFAGCTGLTHVTLPSSYGTSSGYGMSRRSAGSGGYAYGGTEFASFAGLTDITVDADNRFYSSLDGVLFNKDKTVLLRCPTGKSGSYTIPNGVTEIASGAFSKATQEGHACNKLTEITIPDSVTRIGGGAFQDCTGLTQITIPGSVTEIESPAFNRCTGLTRVTISNGVTTIGQHEFMGCAALKSISIPASVTAIGISADGVFPGCPSLTDISVDTANKNFSSLGGSLYDKPRSMLIRCPAGKAGTVVIPGSVTTIEPTAFVGCKGVMDFTVASANKNFRSFGVLFNRDQTTLIRCPFGKSGSYVIPSGVTTIAARAFSGCSGLTDVKMPDSVTCIGYDAFQNCTGLPASLQITEHGSSRLRQFESNDYTYTVDNGKATIFKFKKDFKGTLAISKTLGGYPVTRIGDGAFQFCSGLTSVTISETVTRIGSAAFAGCAALTEVILPASVTQIGTDAFSGCPELPASFRGRASSVLQPVASGMPAPGSGMPPSPAPPGVPVPGSVTPPTATPMQQPPQPGVPGTLPRPPRPRVSPPNPSSPPLVQGDYTYVTNADQATIVGFNKDFKGALAIIDTLGGCPVISIGSSAFADCKGLTRVTIPASVTTIQSARGSFASCATLTAIDVYAASTNYSSADGVLYDKGQTTLMFCPTGKTGSYAIPASVTKIDPQVFAECKGLTALTVDKASEKFGSQDGVLFDKEQTTLVLCPLGKTGSYMIPAGVTNVSDQAFLGCAGLTGVTIPDSVTQIGRSAFYGCNGLAAIKVDAANKTYSDQDGALFNKDQTALILYPAAKTKSYAIPAGVTGIDPWAFAACANLTGITIPASVTSIGYSDFSGCTGLTAINVDAANKTYSSLKGVLFNKDQTTLIRCPRGKNRKLCDSTRRHHPRQFRFLRLRRPDPRHDSRQCHQHRNLRVPKLR